MSDLLDEWNGTKKDRPTKNDDEEIQIDADIEGLKEMERPEMMSRIRNLSTIQKLAVGVKIADVDIPRTQFQPNTSRLAQHLVGTLKAQNQKINRLERQIEMAKEKIHNNTSKNNAIR